MALNITGEPQADAVLENPFGLLIGMALDRSGATGKIIDDFNSQA